MSVAPLARSVLVVEGGLWAGEPWLAFDLE